MHKLFFLFLFSAFAGISVLTLQVQKLLRFKSTLWLYYTLLNLFIFILFFSELLDIYGIITSASFLMPVSLFSIGLYKIVMTALWIIYPLLIFRLFQKTMPLYLFIFILVTACYFPISIISSAYWNSRWIGLTGEILFFAGIAFWSVWAIMMIQKIPSVHLQKIIPIPILAILLFIPTAFWDINRYLGIPRDVSILLLAFYILWNVIQLGLFRKLTSGRLDEKLKQSIELFCADNSITDKEKEIIVSILQGQTNKEIAYFLKISEKTVKNHIYSIFQKTGVQSRVLLLIKIYSNTSV